ncbi:hypothetical protein Tco_0316779 [Tanacetum coccineum]
MAAEVPQSLEYRGGRLNAAPLLEDFQDSPDDEEETRSNQEYLNDLEEEYQERALLTKSKRFFRKGTQRFSSAKATDQTECHKCASMVKNKGLIVEAYEWDGKEVSSDNNEMVEVKVLMALAENNEAVSKEGARKGEWIKISMRKKRILGVDQDPSSSGQKGLVFVKILANDTKVSIPGVERPWLSEAEGFILPNHETGRILLAESQRNTTDPPIAVFNTPIFTI